MFQRPRRRGTSVAFCQDSTRDSYFCSSFTQESTTKEELDAITCASANAFHSDKGRMMTATDVADGYAEPAAIGGQETFRPLSLTSPRPPRR